jgi:hypothetical protein
MSSEPRSLVRFVVLGVALALGAWLRLRGLATLPLHGDEYHTLFAADRPYREILTTYDVVGSHVALPFLQRLALDLFGPGLVSFRMVAIVPGLLLLAVAYPLLCAFVRPDAAALASAALALNPMAVFYARFARGYALALVLALLLAWALARVLAPGERGRATWLPLVLAAALLPWVHLSSVGALLGLAHAGHVLAARRSRALGLRLAVALASAAALALALFAPVLGQVLAYFRANVAEPAPLGWLGVPTLLAGGRTAAWALIVLALLGTALAWRAARASAVLAVSAALGALAFLLATRPSGMDYAWARYLLCALPLLLALAAHAWIELARRARLPTSLALVLGSALLLALVLGRPTGPRAPRDGSFSNTYLALEPLPAFDEPFPATPELYRRLAADPSVTRIVEAPSIYTRSVYLYRNYALQHGKPVLVGWTGDVPRALQRGGYVRLLEAGPEHADWLLLHRDLRSEVTAYFTFVFEDAWPRRFDPALESFVRRQEAVHGGNLAEPELVERIAAKLVERHGPPDYADDALYAWRLSAR